MSFSIQVATIDSWSVESVGLKTAINPLACHSIPCVWLQPGHPPLWPVLRCCMAQHSETRMVLFNAPGPFNMLAPLPGLVLSALLTSPSSPYMIILSLVQSCLAVCLLPRPQLHRECTFWRVSRFFCSYWFIYVSSNRLHHCPYIMNIYIPHHLPGTWHMIGT